MNDEQETTDSLEINPDDIKIYEVRSNTGGDRGLVLKDCYFQPIGNSGAYRFKDLEDQELHARVENLEPFHFKFDQQDWEMTVQFEGPEKARGDWKLLSGIIDEEDSGTFHAQAGGGVEEEASCATA